jgi:predicted ATPase
VITELRIGNARVFDGDDWEFPISRMTILCGSNSAGKSTVLKCLLLLRQAVISRDGSIHQTSKSRLRFSGGLIDLGSFRSFISHNATNQDLLLGITFASAMDGRGLIPTKPGTMPSDIDAVEADEEDEEYIAYELVADFRFGLQPTGSTVEPPVTDLPPEQSNEVEVSRPNDNHAILKEARFSVLHLGKNILTFALLSEMNPNTNVINYVLRLPRAYVSKLPELEAIELGDGDSDTIDLRTLTRGVLPERIQARQRGAGKAPDQTEDISPSRFWPIPSHIEEVLQDLRMNLFQVSYLGPLRAPAQRYYTGQSDSNLDLDVSGESLPYILRDKLEELVYSASPVTHERARIPLSVALNSWLYYLRTGFQSPSEAECRNELSVSSPQDVLVSLSIRSFDGFETHPLADSGFGYSQVLPILVKGLMMSRQSLLLIEQPEVHLNPALQVRMADFFVAMALAKKQILVETHSEHIVNAVRAASAESSEEESRDTYMILYLESQKDRPKLHKLNIATDGTVPDWPRSFFGESSTLLGRILRAQRKNK